jgi:adenylosuccinate synthase
VPVTVVVGGQYGSEGKGKVAQYLALEQRAAAIVRVGGPNSGHTGHRLDGSRQVLRQLPTAALLPGVTCVLPAGSYLDIDVLREEITRTGLGVDRLLIDHNAVVITDEDRAREQVSGLGHRIGSTCSGVGTAVTKRIERISIADLVGSNEYLAPYLADVSARLREVLDAGGRVIVEGTQGFGLSLLHSLQFPNVTSRDTSAAGALSEAGLSPLDVDEVVLVLRSFPIRVAGNSGTFGAEEITWETVTKEGGHSTQLAEYTSVTNQLRRIARFDSLLVRRAITCNSPSKIVLNHVDYIDSRAGSGALTDRCVEFVEHVSREIGRPIDLVGLGPNILVSFGRPQVVAA